MRSKSSGQAEPQTPKAVHRGQGGRGRNDAGGESDGVEGSLGLSYELSAGSAGL